MAGLAAIGRVLLGHRDSGRIAAVRSDADGDDPHHHRSAREGRIERQDAIPAAGALASFVLGWVIYEQRQQTRELVATLVNIEDAFDFSLDALVVGLGTKAMQRDKGSARERLE